jgi:aminopeptidase YwaD
MNATHSSRTRRVDAAMLGGIALAALSLATLLAACGSPRSASDTPPAPKKAAEPPPVTALVSDPSDPTSLNASIGLMSTVFDPAEAMKLLSAIDPYYRVRGNNGYLRSLERVMLLLRSAGYAAAGDDTGTRDTADFFDYGAVEPAWTPLHAKLETLGADAAVLHEFTDESGPDRTFVCVNSFPTRSEGVQAPLVHFDASKPAEVYAGAIVFGSQPAEALFERAVQQGGALGVISSYLPEYNEAPTYTDSIRYAKLPYDESRHGFGLNVSHRAADALTKLFENGFPYVKVTIGARFAESRSRTLVARIAGTLPSAGTIAVVGHLDEPGAADNGSGIATMTAMATGYLRGIRDGTLPRPRRSVTFVFGAELECSREWLKSAEDQVDLALVLDMTGEDQAKSGSIALVERTPDPGAIWSHPTLDVHTEWGRSDELRESDLTGTFLNDYMLATLRLRALATGWNVRSNPFEGGSDHESFLERGIPAVLLWHFTDRFYHTSLDRTDKVDPQEMQHVAVCALALLHHYGNAGPERANEVLDFVLQAARERLSAEGSNARRLLSAPAVAVDADQKAAVSRRERAIIAAWARWYREALLSVENFDPDPALGPESTTLVERIDQALHELRALEQSILDTI